MLRIAANARHQARKPRRACDFAEPLAAKRRLHAVVSRMRGRKKFVAKLRVRM